MKVYQVKADIDNYCSLSQDLGGFEPLLRLEKWSSLSKCHTVTEPLTPPEVYVDRPKLRRGDFWAFSPFHTFALPPASVEKVRSFLEEAGELLPLPYKTEVFSIFNVLKCVDCVDPETEALGILNRSYIAAQIPCGIFRDPQGVYMFVSEFTGDPATEFKAYVDRERMTGLIFREVWNNNS